MNPLDTTAHRRVERVMQSRCAIAERRGLQMRAADSIGAIEKRTTCFPESVTQIGTSERGQRYQRTADQIVARRRKARPETNQARQPRHIAGFGAACHSVLD